MKTDMIVFSIQLCDPLDLIDCFLAERGELQLREEASRARALRVAEAQLKLERELAERKQRMQQQSQHDAEQDTQQLRATLEAKFLDEVCHVESIIMVKRLIPRRHYPLFGPSEFPFGFDIDS